MRCAACAIVMATACSFTPGVFQQDARIDDSTDVAVSNLDPPWWDNAWGKRRRLVVTTGANRPDKGYAGYTVRLAPLDAGCDVRVVTWTDSTWTVLPHHLLGCDDLRFALPVDVADATAWTDAFVYYDNPSAPAAPVAPGQVYRFWDDASADRAADYDRGRMDAWLSTGHDNSLAYDGAGFYTYDTGDDSQSSYRIDIDERDVLVEAEWFHTGCYTNNMQSSVCLRGKIASGSAGTELSDHYYCSSRAQNPSCNNNDQAMYDGDIVKSDNETIAVQGTIDPPALVANQWRRQALAAFGVNPTHLRFWDADASWPALAMPPSAALLATGDDATDFEGRGFAGVMTAQDIGRIRNLVIRRYVEPEPSVAVESEVVRP
jgi:hypothetical protein